MQFFRLIHPMLLDLRSDQYSSNSYRKPVKFAWNVPWFRCHRMNISRIGNLNAGGERVANSEQCMYWSCHGIIRTQILQWSQSCRNLIWNRGLGAIRPNDRGFMSGQGNNPPKPGRLGLWDSSITEPNLVSGPNRDWWRIFRNRGSLYWGQVRS